MNIKVKFGIAFIISIMVIAVHATVPISGKIIEESTGSPLEYVNIVLLSLPDSAFMDGTVSRLSRQVSTAELWPTCPQRC